MCQHDGKIPDSAFTASGCKSKILQVLTFTFRIAHVVDRNAPENLCLVGPYINWRIHLGNSA